MIYFETSAEEPLPKAQGTVASSAEQNPRIL
jgi:hypothetical protein